MYSRLQSHKHRIFTDSEDRPTSSVSQNTFTEARPFRSIREQILADIEKYDRQFDDLSSQAVPSVVVDSYESTSHHHHRHHHCDPNHFYRSMHCIDGNRLTSAKSHCASTPIVAERSDTKVEYKSPSLSIQTNLIRSKSCPTDLFTSTNDVDDETPKKLKSNISCKRRLVRSHNSPEFTRHSTPLPCRKKIIAKKKSPDAIDEFLTSKMVRSNLAANLRHEWARKKIMEMTDKRIQASPPAQVTKYIPKCHRWNVRDSSAWKSFRLEE